MSTSPNVRVTNLAGANGGSYVSTAGPHVGDFYAIQFTADTTITAWTGNISGTPTETFNKGDVLYGRWSSVSISGAAILHHA